MPDRAHYPFSFFRPIIIGDDRNDSIIQSEHRHEHKTLQLEIHAKDRRSRSGKGNQDPVHAIDHHRADRLHDNRRNTDSVNLPDHRNIQPEAFHGYLYFMVFRMIQPHGQNSCHNLADDGCSRRTRNSHLRTSEQSKDHNRIHNNIDNCTDALRDHCIKCLSCRLQKPLKHYLGEYAEGQAAADRQIFFPAGNDLFDICLAPVKRLHQKEADHQKQHIAHSHQKNRIFGNPVHSVVILCPQRTRQQRIDTHGGTYSHCNHQVLDRKCHGHGRQRIFTDLCNKDTVYNIIQCLYQHGYHDRQGHGYDQPVDRHDPHLVLFHFSLSSCCMLYLPEYKQIPKGLLQNVSLPVCRAHRQERMLQ